MNHSHPGFRGRLDPADVATRLGRPIDAVVPYDRRVLAATNSGEPAILSMPRWRGFSRTIRRVAKDLASLGEGQASVSSPELASETNSWNGTAEQTVQAAAPTYQPEQSPERHG